MPLESTVPARTRKIKLAEAQELQDRTGLRKARVQVQAPEKMARLTASSPGHVDLRPASLTNGRTSHKRRTNGNLYY